MSSHSSARSVSPTGSQDDHEAVWGDDTEMLEKTRDYQKRVKKALRKGIVQGVNPTPWDDGGDSGNQPDIPWKLRVFEFAGDDGPSSHSFENPRELLKHWRAAPNDAQTARRVVILEDMNARMCELLGVLLDIPPEFFLAHSSSRMALSVVDRFYAKKGSSTYWKVRVPQTWAVPADFDGPPKYYDIKSGLFKRDLSTLERRCAIKLFCPVSYWGSTHGDGSWTAVVLVDSSLVWIRNPDTGEVVYLEKFEPGWAAFYEAVVDPLDDEAPQPYERFLFDAMVDAYGRLPTLTAGDPFTATALVRNLIYSTWEESLLRDASTTDSDIWEDEDLQFEGLTTPQQSDELIVAYQNWNVKRRNMRQRIDMLRLIIWMFCPQGSSTRPGADVPSREREEWRRLEQGLEDMDAKVGNHMKTYAQLAIMRESFEGYRQTATSAKLAKSSGRLLNLATVFVPFTLVASIFSMNGDFAAGENRFFVFWTVSIPGALALLVWVMYTELWEALWKKFKAGVSRLWVERGIPRGSNSARRQLHDEEKSE